MGPKCLGFNHVVKEAHLQVNLNQRVDSWPYQVGNIAPK